MKSFTSYNNKNIEFNNCPACDYKNHKFELDCGMAYEDELFTLSQDWELPIPGFLVISPKRHIENFNELTDEERIKIFEIINKCINILKKNNICQHFNVIFEEKSQIHFHIWIMPRHDWMIKIFKEPTKHIKEIFEHSKNNMRSKDNLEYINKITKIVKKELDK